MIRNGLIIILAIFISCSNTMDAGKWKKVRTKGIQEDNISFDFMSFLNKNNFILLGSSYTDENLINKRFEEFDAVVYHTSNGGRNWHGQKIGKGKFSALLKKDSLLVVAVNTGKNGEESGSIYSSDDSGITWKNVSHLKSIFVRNICVDAQDNIYVIGKQNESVGWLLLRKQQNADVWDTVSNVDAGLTASPEIVKDHLLFVSMRDITPVIHYISLNTGQTHKLSLADSHFQPYFINSVGNKVYITGRNKDAILVYECDLDNVQKNQIVLKLDAGDKFPVQLHYYEGRPLLLVGEKNAIGVIYYLYYRNANNTEWRNVSVPSSYFSPVAFYNNTVWGYSSDNQIYYLELSSQAVR